MMFEYLQDGVVRIGQIDCDPHEALQIAAHVLSAEYDDARQEYVYEDPDAGWYAVDEHALTHAGAAVMAGVPFWDWYTVWCTKYGDPVNG